MRRTTFALLTVFFLSALCVAAGPTVRYFYLQSEYPTPTSLWTAGDVDKDGNTDIVWINPSKDHELVIMMGNGDGTFRSISQIDLATSLSAIAIGDFNGDGKPDLAVLSLVESHTTTIYILPGNGDGTFGVPTSFLAPSLIPGFTSYYLYAADFNGDGNLDLVAVTHAATGSSAANIITFPGNGNGTFASALTTALGSLNSFDQFLMGDMNEDGVPDLVLAVHGGNELATANHDGTFQPLTTLDATGTSGSLVDLNSDGHLDFISLEGYGDTQVLLGDGSGTLTRSATVSLPPTFAANGACSISAIDVDGDGILDLLLAGCDAPTAWAKGNGDGTFSSYNVISDPYLTKPAPWLLATQLSSSLRAALNGPDVYIPTVATSTFSALPAQHDFGSQVVGTVSSGFSFTLQNTGSDPLTISSIEAPADFGELDSCQGTSIPSGGSCAITVNFFPQTLGQKYEAITINNSSSFSSLRLLVQGNAIGASFAVSPTALSFGYGSVGTLSSAQIVTVTAATSSAVNVSSISGDFVYLDGCAGIPATSCQVKVWFNPRGPGAQTGTLLLTGPGNESLGVSLSGTGYAVGPKLTASPDSLTFDQQYVGTSSAPQIVSITNSGDAPLALTSTNTGTAAFTVLNACGSSVAPGSSCAVGVFFDPSSTGSASDTLTIASNDPSSPTTFPLSGNGVSITVDAGSGSSTSQTIASGGTATYSLTITPNSGFAGALAVACSGAPSGYSCTPDASSITLDGKDPATLKITVSSATAAAKRHVPMGAWLLLLPLGFLFSKRRIPAALTLLVMGMLLMPGCGSDSSSTPPPTTNGTVYVLNATFKTASGNTVQQPLTLIVQK